MRPSNSVVVNAVSCSASFNSSAVWATDIIRSSFQIAVSSGSCVGTFKLQASNDRAQGLPPNQFTPTNWNDVSSNTSVSCSSTATARAFISGVAECSYEYLKIVYTDASGGAANGVVSVTFNAKAL